MRSTQPLSTRINQAASAPPVAAARTQQGVAPAVNGRKAIDVFGLTVSYHEQPVLRDVSASIADQQLLAIIGPNGAGKSTLLKAILGLIPIDSGSIRIFGESIDHARQRVAYVPQTETVDWDFPITAVEVVQMGRYPALGMFRRPNAEDRRIVAQSLEMVGMSDYAGRHIRQLSGGQQQRIFLARALAQQADILLLDEPFVGVDARTEATIFRIMEELARAGKTVIVVIHDLGEIKRFDTVLMLNRSLVAHGPVADTLNEANLRRTYGGRLTLLEQADQTLQQGIAEGAE